jgi:hypothetical protein
MSRIYRSPIFRNTPPPEIVDEEVCVDEDGWAPVAPMAMNPSRPTTLALDLIEVEHQLGAPGGRTRITADEWASVFYRGDDAQVTIDAKKRGFERWKKSVREAGFDCTAQDRLEDPEGYYARAHFCIDMDRAIPWAEDVLQENEDRVIARKRAEAARKAAAGRRVVRIEPRAAGRLVPLYKPVVKAPRIHAYVKPAGARAQTAPCAACDEPFDSHAHQVEARVVGNPRWRIRA